MRTIALVAAAASLMMGLATSQADAGSLIPYQNIGTYNSDTYSFSATATGDITAYFTGASAGYDNQIGLFVNGVSTGVYGLDDHSTPIGQSLNLGPVNAGDTLTFVLDILTLGGAKVYSDPALNVGYDGGPATGTDDGHNHIYSTSYDGLNPAFGAVPAGTYVAFEDLSFPNSDYDYNDETFVFTNTSTITDQGGPSVPEPATWALMLLGVGAVGAAMRAARRGAVAFAV
jgi:hypothetical protein